jgi:hypothetical protein
MKHRHRFFSQQRGKLVTLIAYSSVLCGLIYAYSLDNNLTKRVFISIFACSGLTVYGCIAKNNTKKKHRNCKPQLASKMRANLYD